MADSSRIASSAAAVKASQQKHVSPFAVDHQAPIQRGPVPPHRQQVLQDKFGRDPILTGQTPASPIGIRVGAEFKQTQNNGDIIAGAAPPTSPAPKAAGIRVGAEFKESQKNGDIITGANAPSTQSKPAGIRVGAEFKQTQNNGNIIAGAAPPSSPAAKPAGIRVGAEFKQTQYNGDVITGANAPTSPKSKPIGIRTGNANRPDTAGSAVQSQEAAPEPVRRQLATVCSTPKSEEHAPRGIKMTNLSHKANVELSHENPPAPAAPSPNKLPKANIQSEQKVEKRVAKGVAREDEDKVKDVMASKAAEPPKVNPARFKTHPKDSKDVMYNEHVQVQPFVPRNDAEAAQFAAAKEKIVAQQKEVYASVKAKGKNGSGIF